MTYMCYRRNKELFLAAAEYMVSNQCTLRKIESEFGIARQSIYRFITGRLKVVNKELYEQCKLLLKKNKEEALQRARKVRNENAILRRNQ